jgi:uncharacterized membrane protein YedE/YeeE
MILLVSNFSFLELTSSSWHWSISGAAIAGIVFLMTWMGRSFGVSTTFENFCSLAGAGKKLDFFKVDIKEQYWRFAFVGGAILGGFIATHLLVNPEVVDISASTIAHLQQDFGMSYPQGGGFLPTEIFNFTNPKGIILSIIGGFLIGFGARYGKGCTSGHAITGLSHLQLPSLITVIGFFIGGLVMTWLIMPLIF